MSIELLHKDIGGEFYNLLDETKQSIYIMSPFISYPTANRLATWLEEMEQSINCKIITRFNREEFIQGANSIQGLERLYEAGAEIYALQHLHTKLYIFDNKKVIMGSANFTLSGFFKNHELGIIIKDEVRFGKNCVDYFYGILNQIEVDYKLTKTQINIELEAVRSSIIKRGKMKKDSNPNEYNTKRWGAIIDKEENDKQSNLNYNFKEHFDILEEIAFNTRNDEEQFTGARIKFEGKSDNRISNKDVYLRRKKTLHEYLNRTYYPRRPGSVQDGEYIFIALLSVDRYGNETPLIVGYAEALAFDEKNITDNTDPNYKRWNGQYPYYIELTNGKFLKAPIENGVSLIELCNELRHKVYPNTIENPETPIEKILKRHHQKAHIKITIEAKNYLKSRIDKLFEEFGYDVI